MFKFFEKQKNNCLLYISLFNYEYYYETICSLLILKEINFGKKIRILIYSDNANFFYNEIEKNNLSSHLKIDIIYKPTKYFRELLNQKKDIFKLKIIIILDVIESYNCNLLFIDNDTIILKKLSKIYKKISKGYCYLHTEEYKIKDNELSEYHNFFKREIVVVPLKEKNLIIDQDSIMWNSGVVGICNSKIQLLKNVLLTYEILSEKISLKRNEQLSFSVCFKDEKLLPADDFVFHYWFIKIARYMIMKFIFNREIILNQNEEKFKGTMFHKQLTDKNNLNLKNLISNIFFIVNNYYSDSTKFNIKINFRKNSYVYKLLK
ncbi:MAG: hypothetical protein BGO86_01985 [Chryseobacterium sp. 36-9]|nr:MAG: hypothetical protein BGO86_01985 [Chryseobacterium sp. 36-9]